MNLKQMETSELIEKKKNSVKIVNQYLYEIRKLKQLMDNFNNEIYEIDNEIQNRCDHHWVRESSGGPYPDKWSQCSKCNKIDDFKCG